MYLFSSSVDSMYRNILTCLLHTAVVSIFGNLRLLCIYLTQFSRSESAYAAISQRALSNKACMCACMYVR